MPEASFSASAIVHIGRWQHHRLRDHFGAESDLYVMLSTAIGPWEEGTPVHFVIEDLLNRLAALESASHVIGSFTCNSYLITPGTWVEQPAGTWRSVTSMDATMKKTMIDPSLLAFMAKAWIVGGATFTANAVIHAERSFTAAAVIV